MDWVYRTPGEERRGVARAALYVVLFLAFVVLTVLFRLFLAAPPEERTGMAAGGQVAVVWEAWEVLERAAGPQGIAEEQAAVRAVSAMALAANEDPTALPKRLETVLQRPPPSVPPGLVDVWRAWWLLRAEHPEVPAEALVQAAIVGLAGRPDDPAARYLEAPQYREARDFFEGDAYEGIGAWVDQTPEAIFVTETFVGGPAEAAGLHAGDRILAVNGLSVEGLTSQDVVALIKGPHDTEVELRVQGPDDAQPRMVVARRGVIPGPSLRSTVFPNRIGYVWLFRFHQTTGEEFARTVQALQDQEIDGLILDLRANPGGSLQGAVGVASQFLSEGIVMYEVTNTNERQDWKVTPGGIALDLPLVVLVNGASASAAEIVAGALQDAGRARVYGTRTYGKGSVQTFRELSNGSALYVTIAHWYTPKGRQIEREGIQPDVEVPLFRDVDGPFLAAYADLLELVQARRR